MNIKTGTNKSIDIKNQPSESLMRFIKRHRWIRFIENFFVLFFILVLSDMISGLITDKIYYILPHLVGDFFVAILLSAFRKSRFLF
jgi:hypothetical protein